MGKKFIVVVSLFVALAMAGCASGSGAASAAPASTGSSGASTSVSSSASAPMLEDCPVSYDDNFKLININISIDDFNALGFAYGDEVDVSFSNGYQITVPYYSGYYDKLC